MAVSEGLRGEGDLVSRWDPSVFEAAGTLTASLLVGSREPLRPKFNEAAS
jgi:hypothetical protein